MTPHDAKSPHDGKSEHAANWKYADDVVVESDPVTRARAHSIEVGIEPVSPAVGAQLALLVAATGARNIMEIGTGSGVSGLWMLAGGSRSVLTSIDSEVEHQAAAREHFHDAGIPSNRFRLIAGRALDVLPRMNENSYDLVLVDADSASVIEYVEHALRLARTGGTVVVTHALSRGRVADPAARDDVTVGYRNLIDAVATSTAVVSALSVVGGGLLQITKLDA
ncbi:O-methyltransferase [Labedella endophytica]|uniref:Methyltransferase n=1 Tax=Labedella endophytica TaxID=1523160 RepID=A0A3S0VEW5_9MICO|nr:class I SAM-dependent methyltransferase [Labedella endophytica]RUQ99248.1 methyltransferase [Labedella endophytica]